MTNTFIMRNLVSEEVFTLSVGDFRWWNEEGSYPSLMLNLCDLEDGLAYYLMTLPFPRSNSSPDRHLISHYSEGMLRWIKDGKPVDVQIYFLEEKSSRCGSITFAFDE